MSSTSASPRGSGSGGMSADKQREKFAEIVNKSVTEQAKCFLHAFVMEFQGKFEQVLDLAVEFQKFVPKEQEGKSSELDELQAHRFLEKKNAALTVKEMRDQLYEIDLDRNHRVAFIEYLLFYFKKTLLELLEPRGEVSPELLAALDRAIEEHARVEAEKEARLAEEARLESIAALGGVKGLAAKNQLEQMRSEDQLKKNKAQIQAQFNKKKAAKDVENDKSGELRRQAAIKEEAERVEAEKKRKEEEAIAKAAESKAKLAARAAMWDKK